MCRVCYESRAFDRHEAKQAEKAARDKAARENISCASPAQLLARERRDARLAIAAEAQKARDERLIKWLADRKEQKLRKTADADAREAVREAARVEKRRQAAAKKAAKRLKNDEALRNAHFVKMKMPSDSPVYKPPMDITIAPLDLASDPWAKIRARTYGKPPLMASNLRQLTPEELMIGRRRRA